MKSQNFTSAAINYVHNARLHGRTKIAIKTHQISLTPQIVIKLINNSLQSALETL
jgi:hypothetical protein